MFHCQKAELIFVIFLLCLSKASFCGLGGALCSCKRSCRDPQLMALWLSRWWARELPLVCSRMLMSYLALHPGPDAVDGEHRIGWVIWSDVSSIHLEDTQGLVLPSGIMVGLSASISTSTEETLCSNMWPGYACSSESCELSRRISVQTLCHHVSHSACQCPLSNISLARLGFLTSRDGENHQ